MSENEMPKLGVYSVIWNWPGGDEGTYAWAGEAFDERHAERRCVDAMLAISLESYDDSEITDELVRELRESLIDAGEVETYHGANMWAAGTMLAALTEIRTCIAAGRTAEAYAKADEAVDKGRGEPYTLDEAEADFDAFPCPTTASRLVAVSSTYADDEMISESTWRGHVAATTPWIVAERVHGDKAPLRARDLREGDYVDLYGDAYADPDRDPSRCYEYELAEVVDVDRETSECVVVGFEGAGSVGFPPDYEVRVSRSRRNELFGIYR